MTSVINKKCHAKLLNIDNLAFMTVDNFLNDPDDFRAYAKKLATQSGRLSNKVGYELYPPIKEFDARYPDFRRELVLFVDAMLGTNTRAAFNLDQSYTKIGTYKGPIFNCVYKLPAFTPHVDPGHISSFIYLNTTQQCSGGTGIYRHLPSGQMRFIQKGYSLEHLEKEPLTQPLNYSAGEWQLLHKFDMQYNRLIAFNSSVIHKIFFEPEGHSYTAEIDQTRLSLNSFFVYSKPTPQS